MEETRDRPPRFEPGPRINTPIFLLSVFLAVSLNSDLLLYFESDPAFRSTLLAFAGMKYGFVGLAWLLLIAAGKIARRIRDSRK
ncbi:MAG: hypothetical protein R3E82_15365 [Pseudomonadales bacterium]|nr:hypothetical protein [Pseudomonadales bacterium]